MSDLHVQTSPKVNHQFIKNLKQGKRCSQPSDDMERDHACVSIKPCKNQTIIAHLDSAFTSQYNQKLRTPKMQTC